MRGDIKSAQVVHEYVCEDSPPDKPGLPRLRSIKLTDALRNFADFLDKKATPDGFMLHPPTFPEDKERLTVEEIIEFTVKAHRLLRMHEEGEKSLAEKKNENPREAKGS